MTSPQIGKVLTRSKLGTSPCVFHLWRLASWWIFRRIPPWSSVDWLIFSPWKPRKGRRGMRCVQASCCSDKVDETITEVQVKSVLTKKTQPQEDKPKESSSSSSSRPWSKRPFQQRSSAKGGARGRKMKGLYSCIISVFNSRQRHPRVHYVCRSV